MRLVTFHISRFYEHISLLVLVLVLLRVVLSLLSVSNFVLSVLIKLDATVQSQEQYQCLPVMVQPP